MNSARVFRGLIDDIGDGFDLFETQGFTAVRIAFPHFRNSGNVEVRQSGGTT